MNLSKSLLSREAALSLQEEIRDSFRLAENLLVEAAIKLKQFLDGRGWAALGYATMTAWREAEFNFTQFYNARSVILLLEAGVSEKTVRHMPVGNVGSITHLLPEKYWKDPAWQQRAIDMGTRDFANLARAEATQAGTAPEEVFRRGFWGPQSLIEKWDLCFRVAEAVDGAKGQEQVVEALVSNYLDGASARPGKSRLQYYYLVQRAG
jgi:hypothetical protein